MNTYLIICSLILCLYVAWNIGANDVANAVGTSVGSGALSLRQAVIIAAIFEFCGAFFLGSHVSETLEGGILHTQIFSGREMDYVYGMLSALFATGLWLQLASYFGWPVSTTHAIVGAVVGFGLIEGGVHAIVWQKVGSIFLSWIISPLLGAVFAYLIFWFIRHKILFSKHPFKVTKKITPFIVAILFFVLTSIVLFGGIAHLNLSFYNVICVSFLIGCFSGGISYVLLKFKKIKGPNPLMRAEVIFAGMQIVIACFMSLAHGSNDVANAIGPLAGIVNILKGKQLSDANTVSTWFLLIGGVGIVIGLATWGWRVIETVGKKITELTPSRGFAAGFASAITIVTASKLGLPISTTHVVVGAVLGVGFARGIKAIDLSIVRDIVISWIVTVPAGAGLTACIFYTLKFFIGSFQ